MICESNRSESCTAKLIGDLAIVVGTLVVLATAFALVWITLVTLVRLAQPRYGPVPVQQAIASVSQIK
jgi:hypothetical protein